MRDYWKDRRVSFRKGNFENGMKIAVKPKSELIWLFNRNIPLRPSPKLIKELWPETSEYVGNKLEPGKLITVREYTSGITDKFLLKIEGEIKEIETCENCDNLPPEEAGECGSACWNTILEFKI